MAEHPREYPRFPIPAVGAIMLEEGHALLIRRGQAPSRGKWTLPGGVIELGETPQEALRREIREECHLDIEAGALVDVIHKVIEDEKRQIQYHYLILDYLASCKVRQDCRRAPVEAGTDVTDVRWIPLDELSSYELTDGLTDVIDKAVAMNEERE